MWESSYIVPASVRYIRYIKGKAPKTGDINKDNKTQMEEKG